MMKFLILVLTFLFSLSLSGQIEICDNEIDDDGDGYIDNFDLDCPCDDSLYQAQCFSDCTYLPDSFPDFNMKLKWMTSSFNAKIAPPNIVAGDIDSDGETEILTFNYGSPFSKIDIFNGLTGELENEFQLNDTIGASTSFLAIADIDRDGKSEIIIPVNDSWRIYVVCYDYLGNKLWKSPEIRYYLNDGAYNVYNANIADFNGDLIPEIYIGSVILNAQTGNILAVGNKGKGSNFVGTNYYIQNCASVAADLLDDPGLELAAGNTVYKVVLNNLNGIIGNQMIPVNADSVVLDGLTAVADINGDQKLDVIVSKGIDNQGKNGGIWAWDPRTRHVIAEGEAFQGGGFPFIGNVDDDCYPEIGIAFKRKVVLYKYNGQASLDQLYTISTSDLSGGTGITMFDFNQDNKNELIYRDETDLMIIEGNTGQILSKSPIKSGTIMEYPIVVDIDNDDEAEILVNGYTTQAKFYHIFAFESDYSSWAPARKVWNQTAYNVTNVNDDLTIPPFPQNTAKSFDNTTQCLQSICPQLYNNFMSQATFRTKNGCVQWQAMDIKPEIISWDCKNDSIHIELVIMNENGVCDDSINLEIFQNNPFSNNSKKIFSKKIRLFLAESSISDTLSLIFAVDNQDNAGQLYLLINTKKEEIPPYRIFPAGVPECNYSNNIDSIYISEIKLDLDLGDDLLICQSDTFVLHAPSGFLEYLWQDSLYADSILVTLQNDYYLQVRNICGDVLSDTINVSYKTPKILNRYLELCEGDSVDFYGKFLKNSGIYSHTINKCDTVVELNLKINQVYKDSLYFTLCPNDSFLINGDWIDSSGEFEVQNITTVGCDSIEYIVIDKLKTPPNPVLVLDCQNGKVKASLEKSELNNWAVKWSNGDTTTSTFFEFDSMAYVEFSTKNGCFIKNKIDLPPIPDLNVLPVFQDTLIDMYETFSLSLDLDSSFWKVFWSPENEFDCPTCMNTSIDIDTEKHIYLKLEHKSGCIYERDFWVYLLKGGDFNIPNIFSPNNDGINDMWTYRIGDDFKIKSAFIFDRWGDKIKEWHNVFEVQWDGTFKYSELNPGVYIYILQLENSKGDLKILKGDITLIR